MPNYQYLSDDCEFVKAEALALALRRSNMQLADVARNLNWTSGTKPDTTKVQRVAGIKADRGRYREWVPYDTALAFIEGLGLDPVDYGL